LLDVLRLLLLVKLNVIDPTATVALVIFVRASVFSTLYHVSVKYVSELHRSYIAGPAGRSGDMDEYPHLITSSSNYNVV